MSYTQRRRLRARRQLVQKKQIDQSVVKFKEATQGDIKATDSAIKIIMTENQDDIASSIIDCGSIQGSGKNGLIKKNDAINFYKSLSILPVQPTEDTHTTTQTTTDINDTETPTDSSDANEGGIVTE